MTTSIEPLFPLTKILIVDDDEQSLIAFKNVFGRLYQILSAGSAQEALAILEKNPPVAVVVSDQRMPKTNGVEFLFHIKNVYPAITRVLITGYADLDAAVGAINQGTVYKYIFKPFDPEKTRNLLMDAVSFHFKTLQNIRLQNHMYHMFQEKTSHAMENYTAWIAHHVNNSLQAVSTFVDLAAPRFNKDQREVEFAKITKEYVARIAKTIHRLENIYRHGLEHFVRVKISALLEFENHEISKIMETKKIVAEKEIREPELEIMADPMAIQQVIRQLVMNAVEASPEGTKIEIKAAKHNSDGYDAVMLLVRDHGSGIPPEIKDKLFFPFMKIGEADPPRGLGLPYVQATVARHGGDIQVDSSAGNGTSVSISLPILQPEKEETQLDRLAREKLKRLRAD